MNNEVRTFSCSNIGHRDENQDRCEIFSDDQTSETMLVVADGMGGHAGGSLAAEAVINAASECWQKKDQYPDKELFLLELIRLAQEFAVRAGEEHQLSPRSTLVALYIQDDSIISVHVGDSRVLQFSDAGFIKRTIDHSIAQLHVLQGKITEEEMASHADQSKLITSIGGEDEPEPEIETWSLADGSHFVVCSDGFWELIPSPDIGALLLEDNPGEATQKSIEERLSTTEGHDNTTVIIAQIGIEIVETAKKGPPLKLVAGVGFLITAIAAYLLLMPGPSVQSEPASDAGHTPADSRVVPVEGPAGGEAPQESGDSGEQANDEATEMNSDDTETSQEQSEESSSDTGGPSHGKLVTVEEETEIPVSDDSEVADKVAENLRESGRIGEQDKLVPKSSGSEIGQHHVVRFQQEYKGLPVIGAEVITASMAGKVVKIMGQTAPRIDIEIEPGLDYEQAILAAMEALGTEIKALDEGQLRIFRAPDDYRLSWYGMVVIGVESEYVVFDAHSGEVLFRNPVVVSEQHEK